MHQYAYIYLILSKVYTYSGGHKITDTYKKRALQYILHLYLKQKCKLLSQTWQMDGNACNTTCNNIEHNISASFSFIFFTFYMFNRLFISNVYIRNTIFIVAILLPTFMYKLQSMIKIDIMTLSLKFDHFFCLCVI